MKKQQICPHGATLESESGFPFAENYCSQKASVSLKNAQQGESLLGRTGLSADEEQENY